MKEAVKEVAAAKEESKEEDSDEMEIADHVDIDAFCSAFDDG